jgi:hypothetical protein
MSDTAQRWDVKYTSPSGVSYRIRVKALSMRDGALVDRDKIKIAKRPWKDGEDDHEFLLTSTFPLYKHATTAIEHNVDGEWQPLDLSEETFFTLPEPLCEAWILAIYEYNPQRNQTVETLKKFLTPN